MNPGLQFRLNQQLTLTPQLQQAIRLLQLSQLELEAELRQIAEGNPLLEFEEEAAPGEAEEESFTPSPIETPTVDRDVADGNDWTEADAPAETPIDFSLSSSASSGSRGEEDFEPQNAAPETLQEHLLWQLNLSPINTRQRLIATVIIDALNADGNLAEGIDGVLAALPADLDAAIDEVETVRRQ